MERHERFGGMVVAISLMVVACAGESADEPDAGAIQPIGATETEADAEATDPDAASEQAAIPEPVDEPEPETEPEPAAEEPDPEIDVTVIPDEITPEYVEAVLVELEQLYIDAYIAFQEDDEPTLEVTNRLGSAFITEEYLARLQQFIDIAEAGYPNYQRGEEVFARMHEVRTILDRSGDCLFVETLIDVSGVIVGAEEPQPALVQLGPRDVERSSDMNPTPWIIHELPLGDMDQLRQETPCSG